METANPIVVEVALKPGDLNLSFTRSFQSTFRWFVILTGFLLIFELVRTPGIESHPFSNPWTPFLLVLAAIFVGVLLPYLKLFRRFKKSKTFLTPRLYTITVEGFRLDSEHAKGDYKWPVFPEIVETKKTFLFIGSSSAALYLPKRCFHSANDISLLKGLLRSNYSGKLKLRRD